jgi:peptidoglycan hydrolase-like protein with peptidoglycan-binding domain
MTKFGSIVPLCFVLASGCSVFDGSEMTTERQVVPVADVENDVAATVTPVQAPGPESAVIPARSLTRDDIRLMQLRLGDVGLDPGPVDGVAGAKTRAAFVRFQTGCARIKPLIENLPEGTAQTSELHHAVNKVPSRQETQAIQSQLRNAGFDSGPTDGVFGNRTRSVLAQLKTNCSSVNDFSAIVEASTSASGKQLSAVPATEQNSTQRQAPAGRTDATKQAAAPAVFAPPQEDIRILQVRLRDAGFDPGPFDGVMGPKTKVALQQYQLAQRVNNAKLPVISGISGQY